jgi:isopentenyldiphosphate isomerase
MSEHLPSGEMVDEVDDDDRVLRVVPRAEMRAKNLLHRAVGILVSNSADEILIHRRALDKDVWPGLWDLAAGGVVSAGESYALAAHRELAEELGIDGAELIELGAGRFADERVRWLGRYFRAVWDGPIAFADGEVIEALWVSIEELRRRLERDAFVPDSVAVTLPFLADWPPLPIGG